MFKRIVTTVALAGLLAGCGETRAPVPADLPPPPTPASYEGVPDAATVARPVRPVSTATVAAPPAAITPGPTLPGAIQTPAPVEEQASAPLPPATLDEENEGVAGGPGYRVLADADPTALAKLFGTPGPGSKAGLPSPPGPPLQPTGPGTIPPRRSVQPNRPGPTATLNTNPNAVRIESIRNTQASFLFAYRQAATRLLEATKNGRLVFASANILNATRTTWSFMFVAPEGPRMWRVIYDTEGNRFDLRELAPAMTADAALIDMSKVLDSPALIERAAGSGLNVSLPVDVINFQVDGISKQPCFIFTNLAQGKQVAVHAYTGQVLRNEFSTR